MHVQPIRILLIEDSPEHISLITSMLELEKIGGFSYTLACSETLQSGLQYTKQNDVDVILLDLSLPDSQGYDTFLSVYRAVPLSAVIILTNDARGEIMTQSLRDGAQDYIIKSTIDSAILAHSIRSAFDRNHAVRTSQSVSEDRTKFLLNATHEGVFGIDLEGNCTFCNDACLHILGYHSSADLIGKNIQPIINICHEDGTAFSREDSPIEQSFRGKENIHVDEAMFQRSDHTWLPVEVWIKSQFLRKGCLVGLVVTFVDKTSHKQNVRALRASERIFREIFEHAPHGIFRVAVLAGPAFAFIQLNTVQETIMGLTTAVVQGKSPENILSPEAAALTNAKYRQCVEQAKTLRYHETVSSADGQKYVETTLVPIKNDQGQVTWILGITYVISETKRTEAELQDAKTHLDNILNTIGDPLFVKDRTHNWIFVNDSFCSLIGYSRQELIGKSDYEFFPKREADVFWEKDEQVFFSGLENINEEAFTDGNGSVHTVTTKKTLSVDGKGNPFIVGTIRDVTQQKQIELALKESEEKFRRLTEQAPIAIYLIRADATYEYINPRFTEIFGYTLKDIPTRAVWFEKAYPVQGYREKVIALWNNEFLNCDANVVFDRTFSMHCKDRSDKIIHLRAVKIAGGKILGTCEDITELKQTEIALLEALASIKTIKGLVPICSHCKRIRTDQGSWQQLEQYFHEHIDADFSHGICDECMHKLYPPR
ncbi:MAG: PAS domain S-box protein [Endomicrobiales bacterium]